MTTFKWLSQKGTILGTVTVPAAFTRELQRDGCCTFVWRDPAGARQRLFGGPSSDEEMRRLMTETYKHIHVRWSFALGYYSRDCIEIYGATPEEIEAIPGFAFAPGAAYLRSLLETG